MRFTALPFSANADDGPDPRTAPGDVPDEQIVQLQPTMTGTDEAPGYLALTLEGQGQGIAVVNATTTVYPVTTLDAVAFEITIDGETLDGTFAGASLTAQQVVDQLNAEAVVDGFDYEPASLSETGQLVISGSVVGPTGEITVVSGLADVGIADATTENGTDPETMSVTVWALAEKTGSGFEPVSRADRRFYKVGTVTLSVGTLKTLPAVQGSIYLQNADAPAHDCSLLIGLMAAPIP